MAIITWSPKDFKDSIELIKILSIKHKTINWDESLLVKSCYNGITFELTFRNYHKERVLKVVYNFKGFLTTLEYKPTKYITGHEFIGFIKHFLNMVHV